MAYTKGITEERDVKCMAARCGAAVNIHRILAKGTDPDEVIQAAGGGVTPLGVSGNAAENHAATYVENDPVEMKYSGVVYIEMAGAGVRGDRVMADSVGRGIRHVNTDGVWVVGIATKLWAAGEIIAVQLAPQYIGDLTVS